MNDPRAWLAARVRTMRIIAVALPAGAVMMASLMIYLRSTRNAAPDPDLPILSLAACGLFVVQVALSFIVPRMIRRATLRSLAGTTASSSPENLVGVYQTCTIIALALLEGAVMFAAVVYLIEGRFWAIAPIVFGIALMAMHLPTEAGVIRWLEDADEELRKLRLGGRMT